MISGISSLEKNFKTGLFKSSSHCYFGFPDGSVIDAQPLQKIPRKIEGLHFYAAEGVCELISELKKKGVFEEISYLSIACSYSDTLSQDLLDQFDSVNLTKLQTFDLGAARYYCETHEYYKNLGDITGLLAKGRCD